MKLGRNKFYIALFAMCLPVFAVANDIPVLNITDNTNPEIAELYQRYQTLTEQVSQIQSERTEKLEENYQAMKDKEQSEANRTLTATTTAATGGGTMEAAQGLSEQNADKTAEQSMDSYIATMRCKYGKGRQVKAGLDEIELPGGNDEQMMQLRAEYIALANDLKERKEALGMRPGIESEKILDKSQMGLYDDENIGITDGAYASLYRAQMLGSEKDKQEIDATQENAKTRVIAGAATAGAGVVGGIAGNIAINKDAPKESSKQINREYDKKLANVAAEQKDISTKLESAIAENAKAVREYNNKLNQYKNQIARIGAAPTDCQNLFDSDQLNTISNAQLVENEIDNVPTNIDFSHLSENQTSFNECLKCEERGMVFDSGNGKCQCPNDKPIERDGRCMTSAEYECLYEKEGTTWDGTCKCKNAGYTLMYNTCVPDIEFDDDLDDLLVTENFTPRERECRKISGAVWDTEQEECVCALPNQEIDGDKCVAQKSPTNASSTENESDTSTDEFVVAPIVATTNPEATQTGETQPEQPGETEKSEEENENSEGEYCPATGNRLKSINDKTKIGDGCSSSNIAAGEVVWYDKAKTKCTCVASLCNKGYRSEGGQCIVDKDQLPECPRRLYNGVQNLSENGVALKFCESKSKKVSDICESSKDLQACKKKYVNGCKVTGAIKNYNKVKDSVLCNATQNERDTVKQRAAEKSTNNKLKYYNCCDTRQVPKDIVCKCVSQFSGDKVTPNEAKGLMKEYAFKNHKDDIQCDDKTHRNQDDGNRFRQCASKKNSKWHYEFTFKSLDGGNSGFDSALCSIWGLKSGRNLCKNATSAQCKEISSVIDRTFVPGGSATMQGKDCVYNTHPVAESRGEAAIYTGKILTIENMRTINNINPIYFYDANQQVNANSDVYKVIEHYLFVDLKLPVKQFRCGNGFTDNVSYYNGSRKKYDELKAQHSKCVQTATMSSMGTVAAGVTAAGSTKQCDKKYPIVLRKGDLLTCDYDGQKIDFLFRKLDAIWDRKSTGGYQAMLCLNEGGSFTGKSCAVADKNACEKFNKKFLAEYPDSKGMEWDGQTCVLKDTRYVARVRKYAEVAGFGAVTLASAVGGGPIVWILSGVEAGALVTEAVAEAKLSDWAEEFLVAAAKCNNSSCANSILKKHIARIDKGSKYFSDSQNHQIARQIQRLVEMLDAVTMSQIIDRGNADGYIGEDRDPELEKALVAYYGTELSSADTNLIRAKKIATVATFATFATVTTAGLRVAVKKNWLHIDKARAAKWVDWKILKAEDVSEEVLALTKQGKKISAGADVASGAVKSWEEELAEIGVKEETASNGVVRYRDIKTGKYISKDEVLKRIDNMPGKNTTPKPDGTKPTATPTTPTPKASSIENIENKLGDRYKNAKPEIKRNPDRTAVFEKYYLTDAEWETLNKSLAKENLEVVPSGQVMFIRQKRVFPDAISDIRNRVYSEFNAEVNKIKNGAKSELNIPKAHLSDSEWKMLEADLKKEGLEITEANSHFYTVRKAKNSVPKPTQNPTPKPTQPKPDTTPTTPKRTPAQEEAEWRALYEEYAPKNQTFDNFKKSFGNDLDKVQEYSKSWSGLSDPKQLDSEAGQLWTDFHKKYDADDSSFLYDQYKMLKDDALANGTYKLEKGTEKIPGLESWTKEKLEDANKVYEAQQNANIASGKQGAYSTFDPEISALKRELHQNSTDAYNAIYKEFSEMAMNKHLTDVEIKELKAYIEGGEYDDSVVLGLLYDVKDNSVYNVTNAAKTKYQEFLKAKSENVQKIDKAAGLHAGVDRTTRELIAKNEFVQDFVSKRVSMYEDIITKNPSIYNRAKRWDQLSINEKEKLCKEIFEIADDKIGVKHTEFAFRDLVKDFGEKETVSGLHTDGKVYLSIRHYSNSSFEEVMQTLSHEQAHKVDKLNPNRGILGAQLADLGRSEGYIQGYKGHAYADYRKELTEQSAWMVGDAVEKAMKNLGF